MRHSPSQKILGFIPPKAKKNLVLPLGEYYLIIGLGLYEK